VRSGETLRLKPFGLLVRGNRASILELDPNEIARLVAAEKLLILRDFAPLEKEAFLTFCASFPGRKILEWEFGPVMEMRVHPDPKNYLFSRERVPFHWDGAFHQVPSFLVFQCVKAPRTSFPEAGGETLFCHTPNVISATHAETLARWKQIELTYTTVKTAHYGGEFTGPLVQCHPKTGETVLRYAEPVETELNPVSLSIQGVDADKEEEFLREMEQRIYDPAFCYAHDWSEGEILFADNHSLIHGRRAFAYSCDRHLRRIQLL
jgi:alpha-ketoglutarate-dependent taurine dioxygenase